MSDGKTPPIIGKKIKLSHAKKMVADYKAKSGDGHIHSLTISADHLRKIIDQPDCHYVKFHVALSDPTVKNVGLPAGHTLVMAGLNSASKTIVKGEEDTEVYDEITVCPPTCNPDPDSELV
jgi:hypothetical protein